ncbi:MAG TPA: hypothetical protein VD947_03740 [Patescibacteria group bacterium]|nr:hypothetical protein [Patescibacteria group bacterium]
MTNDRYTKKLVILGIIAFAVGGFFSLQNCFSTAGGPKPGYCPEQTEGLIYFLPAFIIFMTALSYEFYKRLGKKIVIGSLIISIPIALLFSSIGYRENTWGTATDNPTTSYYKGFPFTVSSGNKSGQINYSYEKRYAESYIANYIFSSLIVYIVLGTVFYIIRAQKNEE